MRPTLLSTCLVLLLAGNDGSPAASMLALVEQARESLCRHDRGARPGLGGAWAVHSLCARADRRPAERDAIETHRQALVQEMDRRGVSWQEPQGSFGCETGR